MTSFPWLHSASFATFVLVAPSLAFAQTDEEPSASDGGEDASTERSPATDERARELYENGAILFEEAQYEAAIRAWEESYRLSGQPLLLYNIASAWERLNHIENTLDYLNQYRAFAPADERERLERRIRALETRLDEQRAQARAEEEARLAAQSAATPEPAPTTQPAQVIIVRSADETPRGLQIARWTLLGTGIAGLGAGAAFAVISRNARADAEAGCTDVGGRTLCEVPASANLDAEKRNALVADIAFAVGGTALVASIVTFIIRGRAPEPTDTAISPWMSPDGGGFVFSTSF